MIIVLTAYPDMKSARQAGRKIVEKELAACVSIVKIEESVYRWKGKIKSGGEFLLIIKTTKKAYLQLEAFIRMDHPYELAEVIMIEVKGGSRGYLEWISSSTLSNLVTMDISKIRKKEISAL
ncbi:divalent-cation tolerance protein CutA [Candidatus Micrarchaeota archaeon]|nr:divalent-cation tolerance protein CutA [Candidatus Micrarchaeota archaeon]